MKKKLVLVAAPPACGKTYVSELIAKSVEHIVYLDKDDLSELVRCCFALQGQPLDMDGEFYKNNLRQAEYNTILHIALSTLRFEDVVLLNAPLGKEIRNVDFMHDLKAKASKLGAELIVIWVTAPIEVCRERMKQRNSDRDRLKLENWEAYVKNIDYSVPEILQKTSAVDSLIVFDTADDESFDRCLKQSLEIIKNTQGE